MAKKKTVTIWGLHYTLNVVNIKRVEIFKDYEKAFDRGRTLDAKAHDIRLEEIPEGESFDIGIEE